MKNFLPGGTCRSCEVTVYAFYGCLSEPCNLGKQSFNDSRLCVVSINENGQTKSRFFCFNFGN
ncbi:protein of unknown function [Sterolibacterium denitrificans]|uniref:Uncharacterized protein n=1 Tax=Sterolibacterium denitrificans TaxID=157592 RepID=A0A7Z7MU76_9PROT|nr:protein of unknown function [Sterolibacterium denitrificans]